MAGMEGSPEEPEERMHFRFNFNQLSLLVSHYFQEKVVPYTTARYLNRMYDDDEFASWDPEERQEWLDKFPRFDDDVLEMMREDYESAREQLTERLGVENKVLDSLVEAVHQEAEHRRTGNRYANLVVPRKKTHRWFAEGVLTMSQLTGETYLIHFTDTNSGFYTIDPTSSLEEIFPEQDTDGWPHHGQP